jgi:hypothetical protein
MDLRVVKVVKDLLVVREHRVIEDIRDIKVLREHKALLVVRELKEAEASPLRYTDTMLVVL